jgi:hypothetical protein
MYVPRGHPLSLATTTHASDVTVFLSKHNSGLEHLYGTEQYQARSLSVQQDGSVCWGVEDV